MNLTGCPPCGPGSIRERVFQGIFPWLITCASLYTVQGVPKSGVAPPWKKCRQSHEDHEMPMDQPGLRQKM